MKYLLLSGLFVLLLVSCTEDDNGSDKSGDILPSPIVWDIYIDDNGVKWVATDGGLVAYHNSEWFQFDGNAHISTKSIYQIAYQLSSYGPELWLATNQGTVVSAYDIDAVTSATTYDQSFTGFQSNESHAIAVDTGNARWIGNHTELAVFKGSDWYLQSGISSKINAIATDDRGWCFVGTANHGIERYQFDLDAISGASTWDTDWSSLPSNTIFDIYTVDDTCQWIATDKGVAYHIGYDSKAPFYWETYSTSDGLLSDSVLSIARDQDNIMWFGTTKGLSAYDQENGTWNSMTTDDGIAGNRIQTVAVDQDGSIWIGTPEGVSHISGNSVENYK